jgi:hypothetical protein
MNKQIRGCFAMAGLLFVSCANDPNPKSRQSFSLPTGTFGYDLTFLQQHDSVMVLKTTDGESQVLVSPKYQGKVFTSTAEGEGGKSFGWINYKAFSGPLDPHMNAYGGENRLWLGPEGGPFSLFFPKNADMTFSNWKTPAAFDTEPWAVKSKSAVSVQMEKRASLTNYAGTVLDVSVSRHVSILERGEIQSLTSLPVDSSVKMVGYKTINILTNTGQKAWTERSGAPCIWMLDMLNPSPETTIVIPYNDSVSAGGKVATTNYFGEIPADRVKYSNGILFFKADGKSRGKLGLTPLRAKPVAGSWDAASGVLTIALFDVDKAGKYLNQEWTTSKPPFGGDAVNAYNDGPLADGKQMGPFYEIESVSPAAFLQPGASLTHNHTVLHFTGNKMMLDSLAKKLLGISLDEIQKAL